MPSATVLAGDTFVTVTHGLGYTPTLTDLTITPQDDLAGRSYWPSTPTATTFLINIGSMDIGDHVFGWDALRTSAPAGTGYCTYVDVRRIIETSLINADITELIALADVEMRELDWDDGPTNLRRKISMYLTASLIAAREPSSRNIGGSSETYLTPDAWRKLAEALVGQRETPGGRTG